ncbi:MAG: Ig-like domain repeat protein [Mycobacteriales bacterium]
MPGFRGSKSRIVGLFASGTVIAAAMVAGATPALAATAPGVPTLNSAIPGNNQVTLNFTAPTSDGGSAITGYVVSFSPPASSTFNCPTTTSPCVVTGLTNSTTYTLSIAAKNAIGTGSSSATMTATPPGVAQTITFPALSNQAFNQTPQTLHATSTSGLTVVYTSATTSVCDFVSGALTFKTAGTCTINADQPGNGTYLPASQQQRSFTITAVVPGPPTNLLGTAGVASASLAFTPPTTANSGGDPITGYHVTINPGNTTVACAASPCSLTGLTNGTAYTFTMTATSAAGTGLGSAVSNVTRPNAISQTITFNQPTTPQNFGATPTLTATSNATPTLAVTFTSLTTDVCTITSGGALTTVSVGTCTIRADQSGDSTRASATPVERDIVIQKATPTVAVTSSANPAVYGQPLTFTATLTNPVTTTGNVQFNIDGVDVGSPVALGSGGTASYSPSTPLSVGTHTVKATYAGDSNHNTANATMASAQTINKANTVTAVVVNGDTITATVSAASPATGTPTGGVAVTVGGNSVGSATLSNGVATITSSNIGNQGVGATYSGDSNYNGSVGHRAAIGPTVTTHVSSAHAKHNGWYRSPVTVSFSCTPNTAPLSNGCPGAVTRSHDGAGQSVTRTVTQTDGGSTTVTVSPINIDQVKPTLTVKRKANNSLVCHAHDTLSHGATCSVHHTTTTANGVRTVHWKAVAHDRAGNKRVKKGSFTI